MGSIAINRTICIKNKIGNIELRTQTMTKTITQTETYRVKYWNQTNGNFKLSHDWLENVN